MSEADKYDKAIDTLGNLWIDEDDQAAAAYLREHFVTREEYDRLRTAFIATGQAAAQHLLAFCQMRDAADLAIELICGTHEYEPTHPVVAKILAARQALNPEETEND